MQEVFDRIIESGKAPTRQDIADLLSSIAPPGEEREVKTKTVTELFSEAGHSDTNYQGHGVIDTLDSWGEF